MSIDLSDFFRRASQPPKAPVPKTGSRLIKPDRSIPRNANYHTVTEYTVSVQGKDAMSWVCNQAGCAVKMNSTHEAEDHVASTVDTPDINKLLVFEKIAEQEEYVLKYMNWYIVYGKDKRVQRILKRLVPRLFPSMK